MLKRTLALLLAGLACPTAAEAALSIPLTVSLSEPVVVTGTPQIAIDVGGLTRYATYTSGSGTATLTFTYTPTLGDVDLDGIAVSSPIQLNGGTLKDAAGNNAALTFTLPNTSGIKVSYPSLSLDFTYDADGRYTLNGTAYNDLTSFLTATGGTFSRTSTATYFDSTGTLQTAASGVPRFDYDPVTLTQKGLLIEESRLNGIRNNTMVGAVVGSPGTLPTSWGAINSNGLSIDVVGVGTDSGINYVDLRFYGTSTSTGSKGVSFTTALECPATTAARNSISVYLKQVAGSTANILRWYITGAGRTSGGVYTSEYRTLQPTITTAALSSQRFATNFAFTDATTAYVTPYLELYPTASGVAIDYTLRVGMPQCEQAAFPTSVIKTAGAVVTRASDSLIIPTTSGWYNSATSTLMAQGLLPFIGASKYPGTAALDNGTANESVQLNVQDASTDDISASIFSGGVTVFANYTGTVTAGMNLRQAVAYASNDAIAAANGVLGSVDTSVPLPVITQLRVGNQRGGASPLNGWMQKVRYFPQRVASTQLQAMTQ